MGSAITTQRQERSAAVNGSPAVNAEWPTLLGRMLEDVSRVIQLELQLLEAKLAPSLMAMADRAIAGLMILYAGVIGASCLLAALILFLHRWMEWWQCFAIAGVVTIACALAVYASINGSSGSTETKKS
jgi:Putative Actinobacterial Holin-X, holin superfamily III